MDPAEMEIVDFVKNIPSHKSLLVLAGSKDLMIQSHHAQEVFEAFRGEHK